MYLRLLPGYKNIGRAFFYSIESALREKVVPIKYANFYKTFTNEANLSSFTVDSDGYVVVFTDGACKGNGQRGARAGIGVWFGENHVLNISEPVTGKRRTNNTAEIQAVERGILKAKEAGIGKLAIKTDSQFVIHCVTNWVEIWRNNGWKRRNGKPVANREDWEKLNAAATDIQIKWSYVPGHKDTYGNQKADILAVAGCEKSDPVS